MVVAALGVISMMTVAAHDRVTTAVTWEREIAPIVSAHCVSCHAGQPGTTVSLATYEAARPWARAIREQVLTRRMPMWRAARGYGEYANDPSLSPFEITLVTAWADGGAPKTAPAKPIVTAIDTAAPPPAVFTPPSVFREETMPCTGRMTPTGVLLGLRPHLAAGGRVRVMAAWPSGDRRILGWFRNGDPADATVYWLSKTIDLRTGVSIETVGGPSESCALALIVK
jgi:hypothetical protein